MTPHIAWFAAAAWGAMAVASAVILIGNISVTWTGTVILAILALGALIIAKRSNTR